MDFGYSEDQEALRELARKILEERLTHDRLKEVNESEDRIDREVLGELAKANLLGVAIPESYGGMGMGLEELFLLLEEAGRTVAPLPLYPSLVLGALPLLEFGSESQKQKWLPAIASGDAVLTASLVEDADSEVGATPDGDGFRLRGRRPLVPAGHVADRVLVPAGGGWFLVDPKAAGVTVTPTIVASEEIQAQLELDVQVPAEDVLAKPGDRPELRSWLEERATLALCAIQVGVAERALEMTAEYTRERQQFDRPIGSFQAVHTRAADAFVDVQCMRLTLQRALHLCIHGEPMTEEVQITKYWASEGGTRVTYAAEHLHGGMGSDTDYPVHRYYQWATQIAMRLGGANEQLARIGAGLAA